MSFSFDVERIVTTIAARNPSFFNEEKLLESAAQIEMTSVFTALPRTAQLREVMDWLLSHYATAWVQEHDYEYLLLDTMYQQWSEQPEHSALTEYEHLTARFLQQRGYPVSFYESTFGWEDFTVLDTFRHGTVIRIEDITADRWEEFEGTFAEAEENSLHSGVRAYLTLDNGLERYVRYEGNLAEVFQYYAST